MSLRQARRTGAPERLVPWAAAATLVAFVWRPTAPAVDLQAEGRRIEHPAIRAGPP